MRPVVMLLVLGLAGCLSAFSPSARPNLGISNGTALTVTLFVNGQRIDDFRGGGPYPTINPVELPPLPWNVEARSPSGRVLTAMRVEAGDVRSATPGTGEIERSGVFGRVDLSCGRLTIWAGDVQPSGPAPAASPGAPGDCEP
jgi:hypothetical protein